MSQLQALRFVSGGCLLGQQDYTCDALYEDTQTGASYCFETTESAYSELPREATLDHLLEDSPASG